MVKIILTLLLIASTCSADFLVLKLGTRGINRTQSEMRKDWVDGQIVEILPDTDPISDYMKTHFQIVQVKKKYTQAEKNEILRSSFTETLDKNGEIITGGLITRRQYYMPIKDLPSIASLSTDGMKALYAKQTINPIVDMTAYKESDIIKDVYKNPISTNSFDKGGSISVGTCSIGTGMQYATINAFEADLAALLIGSVTGYIAINYNDTTATTFSGTVTFSSHTIYLTVEPAFRHNGKWDGSKSSCTLSSTDGFIINSNTDFLDISWLQILQLNRPTSGNASAINMATSTNGKMTRVSNCILIGGRYTVRGTGNVNGGAEALNIYNCIISSNYAGCVVAANQQLVNIYNCTCVTNSGATGITRLGGIMNVKNCYSSAGTPYNSLSSSVTNISGADILFNNTNFTNANFDVSGDLSLVSTNRMIDVGTDLSADATIPFSTDIIGTTRPQGASWDIGAFEYVSAEPPAPSTKKKHYFDDLWVEE